MLFKKKTEEALYLIEAGIEINTFGGIELLHAIINNLTEVAKVLIQKDIYMEKEELKRNPLFQAIRCRNKDIVLNHHPLKRVGLHINVLPTESRDKGSIPLKCPVA